MSTLCLAVLLGSLLPTPTQQDSPEPCGWVNENDDYEACPGCPGYSFCVCAYNGAACPSERVICNNRLPLHEGGSYTYLQSPENWCYTTQDCRSEYGGTCHVILNKCIAVGGITNHGTMVRYDNAYSPCGIVGP